MATAQSYDVKSKSMREDLTDFITNISPDKTWCLSNFGRTTATSTYHEWLTDSLASAAENAAIEGSDFSADAYTAPTRLGSYCQILKKQIQVSETANAVSNAGMKTLMAYNVEKSAKELARDLEYMILINSASSVGSAGSARKTNGLRGLISTNTATAASATFGGTAGTAALNSLLATMWDAGADPQTIIVGSAVKLQISAWTANNTRFATADKKDLTSAVDVYRSDFGTLQVIPHWCMSANAANIVYILGDMGLWKLAYLRPMKTETLAKTGDSTRAQIVTEVAIEARNQLGSGKITLG